MSIATLLAGLALAAGEAATAGQGLTLSECTLEGPRGRTEIDARCGSLSVPLDREDPGGARLDLRVAVIEAQTSEPASDPVFFISGGPGQSAADGYASMRGAFQLVQRNRDIVLVDQRGTGGSHRLDCPMPEETVTVSITPERQIELLTDCLDTFEVDPGHFTTSVAVRDLDAVREALGAERISLYGISYGTRVAQHYLRRYPDRVRAAVLDGVVPITKALGPEISLDAQAALDRVFQRCADSGPCAEAFPGLRTEFDNLLRSVSDRPRTVSLRDPRTAEPMEMTFDRESLAGVVRMLSYQTETVALLPLLIHRAAEGDLQPLAAQAVMVGRGGLDQLAIGMHNSVVCTEDVPYFDLSSSQREALEDTYLGTLQVDVLQEVCDRWPPGRIDPDFHDPLTSDRPVLLLSGEADPVTPPAGAEEAMAELANAKHVVAPGQGHGIASRGCMPIVLKTFYDKADPTAPDTECVSDMAARPFFIDFSGPTP